MQATRQPSRQAATREIVALTVAARSRQLEASEVARLYRLHEQLRAARAH